MIQWGVLGTARIATKVVAAINSTEGAQVTCAASRDGARAAAWADAHGIPDSIEGYDALLERSDLQAVYIPLPPPMHCEWTIRAAEKGLHVLCEKPLAVSGAEAQKMADACRRSNVQLMDATMWVHSPRAADMRRQMATSEFGRVQRVTSGFGFQIDDYLLINPAHAAIDASGKTTLDAAKKHELRLQPGMGCGALMDLGWYCVRASLWAFQELPSRVFGTARYENDVDINFSGMMWFSDDRMATFDCGFDMARRKWFEVVGERHSLICDDFVSPWNLDRPRFWIHDYEGQSHEHVSEPCVQEQLMVETLCSSIQSGQSDDQWPLISVANQRVCSALDESARRGITIELDA